MKLISFVGTRPEIIKLSPLLPLLQRRFEHLLVHSGQHYSYEMDAIFFEELELAQPSYSLAVGSASHGEQVARMLARMEPILLNERPELVLVQGDTNTTLAGALCAAKLGIPVVHLEAGCRSFNRQMPEELNRILVDHLSQVLLAPDPAAQANLLAEGRPAAQIALVGSTAIDACLRGRRLAERSTILTRNGLTPGDYLVLTLHRAENTAPDRLPEICRALAAVAERCRIVFPIHPRTAAAVRDQGLALSAAIETCEPLGYIDMLRLVGEARALLTDSGGLQEEAAALGTPALVLRNETEWRSLIDAGINHLVGTSYHAIVEGVSAALAAPLARRSAASDTFLQPGAAERAVAAISAFSRQADLPEHAIAPLPA